MSKQTKCEALLTLCVIDGCSRKRIARGWCGLHYQRWVAHGDPLGSAQRRPVQERFWEKVEKSDQCWEWTASRNACEYGTFGVSSRRIVRTHRYSYEMHFGPIPEGMQVLHQCDNPPCVRPDHLFLGTHIDNMADMAAKGRGRTRPSPTHCPQGHTYDVTNTYWKRDQRSKSCRACHREREHLRRQRRSA